MNNYTVIQWYESKDYARTLRANHPNRPKGDFEISLRPQGKDLSKGPIGWGLKIGFTAPIRDISLQEALLLVCSHDRELLVTWHLDLIHELTGRIESSLGLSQSSMAIFGRKEVERTGILVQDVLRLRREIYDDVCGSSYLIDQDLRKFISEYL